MRDVLFAVALLVAGAFVVGAVLVVAVRFGIDITKSDRPPWLRVLGVVYSVTLILAASVWFIDGLQS